MSVKIHHLNCGSMCPICRRLINGPDAEGKGGWLDAGRLVCHCLLVETASGLILVDSGLGTPDVTQPTRRLGRGFQTLVRPTLALEETAFQQVRAMGFDPRDVRDIILTHLDLDHVGGICDFPAARIHVYQPELDYALHPHLKDRLRYRQIQFSHGPRWQGYRDLPETWYGFPARTLLADAGVDVRLIPLVGHTVGHAGVAVHDGQRWLLHCGDAYFHRSQVAASGDMPIGLQAFEELVQTRRADRLENQRKLKQLALEHGHEVTLFCAHDPVELATLQSPQTAASQRSRNAEPA